MEITCHKKHLNAIKTELRGHCPSASKAKNLAQPVLNRSELTKPASARREREDENEDLALLVRVKTELRNRRAHGASASK